MSTFLQRARLTTRGAIICTSFICFLFLFAAPHADGKRKRRSALAVGTRAVVIDERLAALREEPRLSAMLVRRLGRGRVVAILGGAKTSAIDGVTFYRVVVTNRTRGWIQAESLAVANRHGEDARALKLIEAADGFDRIWRAHIFLETFPRSALRPSVLLLHADAAEGVAAKLTRDAQRHLKEERLEATSAPRHSYFLNYIGLDRYNRIGVKFVYDRAANRFHYDGASWRELLRRHPQSPEAAPARERIKVLNVSPEN